MRGVLAQHSHGKSRGHFLSDPCWYHSDSLTTMLITQCSGRSLPLCEGNNMGLSVLRVLVPLPFFCGFKETPKGKPKPFTGGGAQKTETPIYSSYHLFLPFFTGQNCRLVRRQPSAQGLAVPEILWDLVWPLLPPGDTKEERS